MKRWDCEISTRGEIPAESEINLNLIYETASFSGFWEKDISVMCLAAMEEINFIYWRQTQFKGKCFVSVVK